MTALEKYKKISPEDFLHYLDSIEGKAEYLDGEIYDMAGGTEAHSLIASNIGRELGNELKTKPCRAYNSDLMVEISSDRSLVFPDAFVICGPPDFVLNRLDIVRNPTLVVEVLSKDNADYDRGGKFTKYRSIPSLSEYILIDQYSVKVDVFFRTQSGFWDIQTFTDLEANVSFQSLDVQVAMTEIYRNVIFPATNDYTG